MGRVLVAGAAGFIGARVAELLLEAGHRVVGVDELNDAYDVRLKRYRLTQLESWSDFHFERLDIADAEALDRPSLRDSFDAVVNLAARAGVRASVEDPHVYLRTNAIGTLNLLELCRSRRVRKFLLASTSSLYGEHCAMPFREDACTDRPLSPYAASKKGAEAICHPYHALHGIDVSIVRYFTVYGPAGRPDMSVFRFTQRIREGRPIRVYGDGEQSRDFTYIDDIASGTVAALRPLGFEIVNLGGDRPHRVSELIGLVERTLGRRAQILREAPHPADLRATWADVGKAGAMLDWRPGISLEEGVSRTVDWYERERAWARDVETD